MHTDIPLKRLTHLRPSDLLPLLGAPAATVLGVEALELPASQARLDSVLRLQSPTGQTYLHLIEWQGYPDPQILWRSLGYLAWLGQHRRERPILATIIYLAPTDDMGDQLDQTIGTAGDWSLTLNCIRLWEQDAGAAVASGAPGLLALSPLLGGATTALVEQAAQRLIATVAPPTQGELLAALGVFAQPLIETARFIRMVTKERLMGTDLITYLIQDRLVEFEREKAVLEREKTAIEREKTAIEREHEQATLRQALQQSVEDVIIARFPSAPALLTRPLRAINEPARLQALLRAVLSASDLAEVEQLVRAAAPLPAER
jgi:predicted transposase YdaD